MRIETDRDLCVGSGQCALEAPDVFDQDDDATVVVVVDSPAAHLHADVKTAAAGCPVQAIILHLDHDTEF